MPTHGVHRSRDRDRSPRPPRPETPPTRSWRDWTGLEREETPGPASTHFFLLSFFSLPFDLKSRAKSLAPSAGTSTSRSKLWGGIVSLVNPMSCFSNEAFAKIGEI